MDAKADIMTQIGLNPSPDLRCGVGTSLLAGCMQG